MHSPSDSGLQSGENDNGSLKQALSAAGWQETEGQGVGQHDSAMTQSRDSNEVEEQSDIHKEIERLHASLAVLYAKAQAQSNAKRTQSRLGDAHSRPESIASASASQKESPSREAKALYRSQDHSNHHQLGSLTPSTPLLSPLTSPITNSSTPFEGSMQHSTNLSSSSSSATSLHVHSRQESNKSGSNTREASSSNNSRRTSYDRNMLGLTNYDVHFACHDLPDRDTTRETMINTLVEDFPSLCEAPARMFGSDGQPLPPTKQQEISNEERAARKAAIDVRYRGKMAHSLLKVSVLLESRIAVWKRVSSLSNAQQRPVPACLDAKDLDPWSIPLNYGDISVDDVGEHKLKKTFEMSRSRRIGNCTQCNGTTIEVCRKCKGCPPDECWWCRGLGKTGESVTCKQCAGVGVMTCAHCKGTHTMPCSPCHGEGKGVFAAFLQVTMTKLELDPIPLSAIMRGELEGSEDEEVIRQECIKKAKEMVSSLLLGSTANKVALEGRDSHKHRTRIHRPRSVVCNLHKSNSHLIELEVPSTAKVVSKKKSAPKLRPNSIFQRKIPLSSFYFFVPSDPDLCPVQVSLEELQATLKALKGKGHGTLTSSNSPMMPVEGAFSRHGNLLEQLEAPSRPLSPHLAIPSQYLASHTP